ncbi:MAG: hypothetical protein ACXWNG_01430 [Candidatus Limnocylindrales bacterium]
MFVTTRVLIGTVAGLIFLAGILVTFVGGPESAPAGIPAMFIGGLGIVAVVLERSRYRSQAAEHAADPPGPGGGEVSGPIQPRFQWTAEVFRDPSTGRRMRVYVDPRTGERRYQAED